MYQGLPLQRLLFQAGDNFLNFRWAVGQRPVSLYFIFPGLWTLYLIHRAAVYHIPQKGHFEKAVEDGVDFHNSGVRLASGLNIQK